ncbi:MAG: ATPase P, partial [Dehalococcoidia bacterium]|nr:ATPase P [Dehalococcoidia bacterium]
GNGANDVAMLERAAIGVAVIGPEGAASSAIAAADVVTIAIADALDLLRYPRRLIATLRR